MIYTANCPWTGEFYVNRKTWLAELYFLSHKRVLMSKFSMDVYAHAHIYNPINFMNKFNSANIKRISFTTLSVLGVEENTKVASREESHYMSIKK